MASQRQTAFFNELLDQRTFPPTPTQDELRMQFGKLSQDGASVWIEKALDLPKKDSSEGDSTPPPF